MGSPANPKGLEVGNPVRPADDGLAVDKERLHLPAAGTVYYGGKAV
jgi:hypothetical protein